MDFKFSIEKWNAAAETEAFASRGLLLEGIGGALWCDVLFTAGVKGFVVQHIRKSVNVINSNVSGNELSDKDYYEIFYVGKWRNGRYESMNPDGFVQCGFGKKSSGRVEIIGRSSFYAYGRKVDFDEDGNIIIDERLRKIFGEWVIQDDEHDSAGLPYSEKEPFMYGLKEDCNYIVRKVVAKWKYTGRGDNDTEVEEKVLISNEEIDLGRPKNFANKRKETKFLSYAK